MKNKLKQSSVREVALEDLITEVCECFCQNVWKIHNQITPRLFYTSDMPQWYSTRSAEVKRKVSEALINIMEGDYKNEKS